MARGQRRQTARRGLLLRTRTLIGPGSALLSCLDRAGSVLLSLSRLDQTLLKRKRNEAQNHLGTTTTTTVCVRTAHYKYPLAL
jgi:hypothetical protein